MVALITQLLALDTTTTYVGLGGLVTAAGAGLYAILKNSSTAVVVDGGIDVTTPQGEARFVPVEPIMVRPNLYITSLSQADHDKLVAQYGSIAAFAAVLPTIAPQVVAVSDEGPTV